MTTASALGIVRELRPQAFGDIRPQNVKDPIIEPLWSGIRILAAIEDGSCTLVDTDGDPLAEFDDIRADLLTALAADSAVLDGYLTKQATHDAPAEAGPDWMPSTTDMLAQGFLGSRRNKATEVTERLQHQREATTFGAEDVAVFVAIDLLYIDGESLLDVPLLERKRQLEAVLAETDLIRRSAYIRPPIGTWISSWRTLGFAGLTYKSANGRYHPGGFKGDWATAPMPRR